MATLNKVTPYSFDRLYGPEKYNLNEMELNSTTGFPDKVDDDKVTSTWSDRIQTEWRAAADDIKSTQNGDAFWAGVSNKDLLKFGRRIALAVGFDWPVTGVRIVRYTNGGGFPTHMIILTHGGTKSRKKPQNPEYYIDPYSGEPHVKF